MKISKKRLAQIIKEEYDNCNGQMSHDSGDYEGDMARSQLFNMENNARELYAMIPEEVDLPAWVQAKLTKANDYLSSVKDYLEHEMYKGEYDKVTPCDKEVTYNLSQMDYNTDDVVDAIMEILKL